jgi:ribonuclease P protein component
MNHPARQSLKKEERLKSRKQIEHLFRDGKQFSIFPFRVWYTYREAGVPLQAGFGVSAKNFSRAVDRNRIKRLSRETYRLQKQALLDALDGNNLRINLFFIFTGKDIPLYPAVYQRMGDLLNKLLRLIHEKNTSNP